MKSQIAKANVSPHFYTILTTSSRFQGIYTLLTLNTEKPSEHSARAPTNCARFCRHFPDIYRTCHNDRAHHHIITIIHAIMLHIHTTTSWYVTFHVVSLDRTDEEKSTAFRVLLFSIISVEFGVVDENRWMFANVPRVSMCYCYWNHQDLELKSCNPIHIQREYIIVNTFQDRTPTPLMCTH